MVLKEGRTEWNGVKTTARVGDGSEALGKPSTAAGGRVRPFEEKLMEREYGRSSRTYGDNIKMGIRNKT
jgi:hypothetical protein